MKVLHGRLYGRFYCVLYTFPPPAYLLLLLCRLPLSQVSPDDPDLPEMEEDLKETYDKETVQQTLVEKFYCIFYRITKSFPT